jgi:hypothetical protein
MPQGGRLFNIGKQLRLVFPSTNKVSLEMMPLPGRQILRQVGD